MYGKGLPLSSYQSGIFTRTTKINRFRDLCFVCEECMYLPPIEGCLHAQLVCHSVFPLLTVSLHRKLYYCAARLEHCCLRFSWGFIMNSNLLVSQCNTYFSVQRNSLCKDTEGQRKCSCDATLDHNNNYEKSGLNTFQTSQMAYGHKNNDFLVIEWLTTC